MPKLTRAARKKIAAAIRRYWWLVKHGRIYRRGYSERHIRKVVVTRLKKKLSRKPLRKLRRPPKKRVVRFIGWRAFKSGPAWVIRPEIEFKVKWEFFTLQYGAKVRVLPRGAFYRDAIMVYFQVARYERGADRRVIVGWPIYEDANETWPKTTIEEWRGFVEDIVMDTLRDMVKERHPHWRVGELVFWHFINHRYKELAGE